MARYHFWQFLLNQEGQPIPSANITIYEAGTSTPAYIYDAEIGGTSTNTVPQTSTNNVGFFEFWIGDEAETHGYSKGTKFKIIWEREGIAYGSVDWVDIFPAIEEVDETDTDTDKNKLLSNSLAYYWEQHKDFDVTTDGYPIHGITYINLSSTDSTINKLISNAIGKNWEDHRAFEFDSSTVVEAPGNAHDLQPVGSGTDDTVFNKLVCNNSLGDIFDVSAWLDNGDGTYSITLEHNLNKEYPSVTCWDTSTNKIITPTEVEYLTVNQIYLTLSSPLTLKVKII